MVKIPQNFVAFSEYVKFTKGNVAHDVRTLMQNSHMYAVVPSHCGQTAILNLFGTVFKRKKNVYPSAPPRDNVHKPQQNQPTFTSFQKLGKLECYVERSIFQTFWKPDFGARFLFIELHTSNFGYLLIFLFC